MNSLARLGAATIFAVATFLPVVAQAHASGTDGTITAVMHVTPSDHPVVGQIAKFGFHFNDTAGHFRPELCDCTFGIYRDEKEVYHQDLFKSSRGNELGESLVEYTFPNPADYEVQLHGSPKTAGVFQPFHLEYDVAVASAPNKPVKLPLWPVPVAGLAGVMTLLAVRRRRNK